LNSTLKQFGAVADIFSIYLDSVLYRNIFNDAVLWASIQRDKLHVTGL